MKRSRDENTRDSPVSVQWNLDNNVMKGSKDLDQDRRDETSRRCCHLEFNNQIPGEMLDLVQIPVFLEIKYTEYDNFNGIMFNFVFKFSNLVNFIDMPIIVLIE